jgi:two-component system sensor histidine kinase BaeS
LRTFCDKSLPIKCDRHRMGQLFDNLLENSRRYTSPPGEIVLTVKENGDLIEITIEDTAPTVPGEAIGRLFERFYRVEFSRSRDMVARAWDWQSARLLPRPMAV